MEAASAKPKRASRAKAPSAATPTVSSLQSTIEQLRRDHEQHALEEPVQMADSDYACKRIDVPYKPRIKHKDNLLPDGHLSILIVGASNSGKTTLLLSLIPCIADLSQVILCSLVSSPVYEGLARWCNQTPVTRDGNIIKDENGKDQTIEYASFSEVTRAEEGISEMIARKPEGTYGLVILDDWNQATTSVSNRYARMSAMVTMQLRNFGYHNVTLVQSYTGTTTRSRANSNMRFSFMMHERFTIQSLIADLVGELHDWTATELAEFYHDTTERPHSYICLTTAEDGAHLYRKVSAEAPIERVELGRVREGIHSAEMEAKQSEQHALAEKLRGDDALKAICDNLKSAETEHALPLIRRYERQLQQYIAYLARLDMGESHEIPSGSSRKPSDTEGKEPHSANEQSIRDAVYELCSVRV